MYYHYSIGFMFLFFFFKQKTAYEMRISDWSSDVCSSDLVDVEQLADGLVGCTDDVLVEQAHDQPARRRGLDVPIPIASHVGQPLVRSEERRVGKSVSVRVDLGGRRIIKKKKNNIIQITRTHKHMMTHD